MPSHLKDIDISLDMSQPRSRRVEGFALPAQTAATNLPAAVLLLPHGPASLRCCCCRRRRRVEGDPDLLFLRPDRKKGTKSPHDEDCSVLWSKRSAGSLLLLLLLVLGDFLGFLSGSEG
ncbi:hypothetical protein Q5P01_006338 [Channa striata]|uniref:Uncharacterized protein n=1 Tax=Channa striata TaxID=64152 RepID=A0AA88N8Q1_CHASR|nr:hypothetical protein Q5P01_006338 [Channa striata]